MECFVCGCSIADLWLGGLCILMLYAFKVSTTFNTSFGTVISMHKAPTDGRSVVLKWVSKQLGR